MLSTTRDGEWMDAAYNCSEKTHLIKFLNKIKNGVLSVVYKSPKTGYGRVEPRGCLSLGSLRKAVRHTLCEGQGWVDIDISNCHPELLRQLCSKAGLECDSLHYYCDNREVCLKEVTELFIDGFTEDTRDEAKVLYIRLMYGGELKSWLSDMKKRGLIKPETTTKDLPQTVVQLKEDLNKISLQIQEVNPDMVQAVKKVREKANKVHNFNGSFLSYYMQEWERRMLECVYNMMRANGYIQGNDCVLCYDGIMIHFSRINTSIDNLLRKCEAVIEANHGFHLKFTQKKMKKSLLSEIEAREQALKDFVFPGQYTKELDPNYMNGLPNYETQKRYFELFVAKAMQPDPIYIWTSKVTETDEYNVEYEKYNTQNYDETRLRKSLKHIRSNNKSFLERWLTDPKIRCYNRVCFMPYNGVFDPQQHNTLVYNLFKGYNPLIRSPLKDESTKYKKKVLRIFMDILLHLFEDNRRFRDLFLKSRAFRVQYPQQKLPMSFIITGPQGVGKNICFDAIGRVVGMDHYYSTTNPSDLFDKHAEGFVHKMFVVMNECEGKNTKDLEGAIKGASTDVSMTVNAKFQRPVTMKNLAQLDITTNKPNPIPIDTKSGDRRFLVSKSTRKYLQPKYNGDFWRRVAAHFRSPVFIRCLYDYLNEMDVETINWKSEREACLTKSYYDMLKLYVPSEVFYFEEMYNKIEDNSITSWGNEYTKYNPSFITTGEFQGSLRCRKGDLCKCMNNWLRHYGHQYISSQKTWFNKLTTQLDLPIYEGALHGGYKTVEFDIGAIYKLLIERQWVDKRKVDTEPDHIKGILDSIIDKIELDSMFSF